MRVAMLIHELGRSGGMSTILRYARAFERLDLVVTDPRAGELPSAVDGLALRRLADARRERYDVAIATWWASAASLWEVDAARRVVFLQSIESRFYEERHFYERFAAEQVLALPAGFVVVAEWMREVLGELRPDAPCAVVRGGVDKEVFRPRAAPPPAAPPPAAPPPAAPPPAAPPPAAAASPAGPLRVLVEGQPSLWFKGVADAVAAAHATSQPCEVTVVASDPSAAGGLDGVRVVGGLDPAGMARLYGEHDVLLKLSRVESLGLAPIEAFHLGVPAIVAPYTGHEEYLEHGVNGLVVGHDDLPATARALDRLARDPELRARLAEGALATAARWPSADDAARGFAGAVLALAEGPEPDPAAALAYLQRAQTRWRELGREHARQEYALAEGRRRALDWYEDAYTQAREHVEELNERLRLADELARDLHGQIEAIKASRAYRTAAAARRLRPGGRG